MIPKTVKPLTGVKPLINPALVEHARKRGESAENRVADRITKFSGSMLFVYLHLIWFTCWIVFGVEPYPYGLLTMIVSLEAIFLSTFVMISQNRADEKREVLANQQWTTVQDEDRQNTELLRLSNEILQVTKALQGAIEAQSEASPSATTRPHFARRRPTRSGEAVGLVQLTARVFARALG